MTRKVTTLALLLLAVVAGQGDAIAAGTYEVGLRHDVATLGAYVPSGIDDAAAIETVFGAPKSVERDGSVQCVKRWPHLGMRATFTQYGDPTGDPCEVGTFVEAVVTRHRWVTSNGVRPGSTTGKARRRAVKRCHPATCGVSGYALEVHQTDCASQRVPGVIAAIRRNRVRRLVVRWRSCE